MDTTDKIMEPVDAINLPGTAPEANDNFIGDLFDDEGAFGEADCAGL